MKTKEELEKDIAQITLKIYEKFPELSKYISEIPIAFSAPENEQEDFVNFKHYYETLQNVVLEYAKTHVAQSTTSDSKGENLEGYPHYPDSEDIYKKSKELKSLDPDDLSKTKTPNEKSGTANEKSFEQDMSGDDLDIPGSELDDQQERIGSEDEENNYYSLGGDNLKELEEDNG